MAFIHDNAVILTNTRVSIKNYSYFHFIYNSAKTSSDLKQHFETNNLFVKTYLKLEQFFNS